jgi:hypothetical protein
MPPINKSHPYLNLKENFDSIPLCNSISDKDLRSKLKEILIFYNNGLPPIDDIYSPQWIPNYVDHGVIHHRNVWVIANRLVKNNPETMKPLNDYEKFCFYCSIWLHDIGISKRLAPIPRRVPRKGDTTLSKLESENIGLFLQRFRNENGNKDKKHPLDNDDLAKIVSGKNMETIRDYHSLISEYFIRNPYPNVTGIEDNRSRPDSTLDPILRNIIGQICRFHQSNWILQYCEEEISYSNETENAPMIKTRYLSALLRLLDGMDQLMNRCLGDSSADIANELAAECPDQKYEISLNHHLEKIVEDVSLEGGKIKIKIENVDTLNDNQKAALEKYKKDIIKTLNECIPYLKDNTEKNTLNISILENNSDINPDRLFEEVNYYFPDPLLNQTHNGNNNIPVAEPDYWNNVDLRTKLLLMIRDYPLGGGESTSYAVKEPLVIQGDIAKAKEKPGLGVAIHSTKFALDVFNGEISKRNINSCIGWSQKKLIQSIPNDPGSLRVIGAYGETLARPSPDLRHTVALLVILANANSLILDPKTYLDYVMCKQREDGAWPANPKETVSEIITVIYAIRLLFYRQSDQDIPDDTRAKCSERLNKGIQWLIKETNPEDEKPRNLWSSYATELPWQKLWTT